MLSRGKENRILSFSVSGSDNWSSVGGFRVWLIGSMTFSSDDLWSHYMRETHLTMDALLEDVLHELKFQGRV